MWVNTYAYTELTVVTGPKFITSWWLVAYVQWGGGSSLIPSSCQWIFLEHKWARSWASKSSFVPLTRKQGYLLTCSPASWCCVSSFHLLPPCSRHFSWKLTTIPASQKLYVLPITLTLRFFIFDHPVLVTLFFWVHFPAQMNPSHHLPPPLTSFPGPPSLSHICFTLQKAMTNSSLSLSRWQLSTTPLASSCLCLLSLTLVPGSSSPFISSSWWLQL